MEKQEKDLKGLLSANVEANDLHFVLTLNSGKVRQYLLSPLHAKRLLALFSQLLSAYEQRYGQILEPSAESSKSTEKTKIGFETGIS